jgi:hypothetical protein
MLTFLFMDPLGPDPLIRSFQGHHPTLHGLTQRPG